MSQTTMKIDRDVLADLRELATTAHRFSDLLKEARFIEAVHGHVPANNVCHLF